MRLLVITFLGCIVVTKAMSTFGDIDYGRGGMGRGHGQNYRRGYEYGGREGGSHGFESSGYDSRGGSMSRDYGQQRRDYKATVEGHELSEHDRSQVGDYSSSGGMSQGYGSGGRSEYGRGFSNIGLGI